MRTDLPKTIFLKDYKPFPFDVENVEMNFDLRDEYTTVTTTAKYTRSSEGELFLYGEELELISLKIDGENHSEYEANETSITIKNIPDFFELEIITKIYNIFHNSFSKNHRTFNKTIQFIHIF